MQPGGKSGLGPNLVGVVGRTAGTLAGFNYSPALKASKLKWDEKALDEYLAAPTKKVPGSRMPTASDLRPDDVTTSTALDRTTPLSTSH